MEEVKAMLETALEALKRSKRMIYDPRLLEGYDGFMGPLDHRKQLRERLGRELSDRNPNVVITYERSCEPVWTHTRRKGEAKQAPFIDIIVEVRNVDPYTRKRTVKLYPVVISFAGPGGDPQEDALTISRHGRSGVMPAARVDDMGYRFIASVGNLEAWVEAGVYEGGFALLYSVYDGWRPGVDPFFPHEGQTLEGTPDRPKSLVRKSSPAIPLHGSYPLAWKTWSEVPQTAAPGARPVRGDTVDVEGLEIKYLVVPVTKAQAKPAAD